MHGKKIQHFRMVFFIKAILAYISKRYRRKRVQYSIFAPQHVVHLQENVVYSKYFAKLVGQTLIFFYFAHGAKSGPTRVRRCQ
jgi:hypothetical protein